MTRWLERLRGAVSIGAVWGAAGSVVGALGAVVANLLAGTPLLGPLIDWALGAGFAAALLGTGFAGVLTMVERGRTLAELSAGRAAVWGAVAGGIIPPAGIVLSGLVGFDAALPLQQMIPVLIGASGSYAILTAALAAGTVSLAKRSLEELTPGVSPPQPSLIPPNQ